MLKFRWETKFKETQHGFEISAEWEERKLCEIVESLPKGKPLQERSKDRSMYPYLTVKYLRGEEEPENFSSGKVGTIVNDGDILIIWDGAANAGEIVKGKKGILGSTLVQLKVKEGGDRDFIHATLKFLEEEIRSLRSGTDDRHVDKEGFLQFKVPYPHPTEQSRVAAILSWFDNLIENKKKQNEILENTAMAIFKDWLIDFRPFKNADFVDSQLGKIPKGWEIEPIGRIAELRNGISYSGKEKYEEPTDGGYVFITLNNAIEAGGFKPVYAWIKSDRIKEHQFLEEGDLIIPNTEQTKDERLIGSPGIVVFPDDYKQGKGVYSHHITKISTSDEKYSFLLYLWLKFTREDSASFHTGTGVLGLDIKNFRRNKLVICPPKPLLQQFYCLVEPLFKKIILNQKQIMVLQKIRDALLPLLIFGRLRVEEV